MVRTLHSFIMVTLGTGVGGGIIMNKKLFRGNLALRVKLVILQLNIADQNVIADHLVVLKHLWVIPI